LKTIIQISFAAMLAPLCCDAGGTASLDAVVVEALGRNPGIRAYEAEIAAARGGRRTAGGG
jgi:outer membrane protein TolC